MFGKAILDFANTLEKTLTETVYLASDAPTAADVCTAVWLIASLAAIGKDGSALPVATNKWITGLLSHDLLKEYSSPTISTVPAVVAAAAAPAASGNKGPVGDNAILAKLQELGIEYDWYEHTLSKTADELVANVPIPAQETHTKNLFFKDKKNGLFLVTIATKNTINTKTLGKEKLGLTGKVNLRLADEKLLDQHLKVKPGCVGPLAIMNDEAKDITLVLDEDLMKASKIHPHPLLNDQSVSMTPAALTDYLAKIGVEPMMVSFDEAPAGGAAPAAAPAAAGKKAPKKDKQAAAPGDAAKKTNKKGETLLALQWKKEENFPQWYSDVIVLSEMISYYDISGCYILRPWSYKIWELIQVWFNEKVREREQRGRHDLWLGDSRLDVGSVLISLVLMY